MNDSRQLTSAQIWAAVVTALVTALIVLWLKLSHLTLSVSDEEWPPHHSPAVEIEEYVDMADIPVTNSDAVVDDVQAYSEDDVAHQGEAAPASGSDDVNEGKTGNPAPTVTSEQPAPVKEEKKPDAAQLAAENQKKEEERIRRQTSGAVSGAFSNVGKQNASSNKGTEPGNSGSPSGSPDGSTISGSGSGSVGGGWLMPRYNRVRSTVTGSVKMTVRIDVTGKVTSVTFTGGEAPAGTNAAVRAACEKEVRAHQFKRPASAGEATEAATAYITYVFK